MSLKAKTVSGVKWSIVALVGKQMLALLNKIILARLLLPSAYGLVGMATIVIGFLEIFADLGTSAAIVQREKLTDELTSSVFWVNILFGVLITGISIGCAPLVAAFFQEPRVTLVLTVLSISFLLSSFSIVQQALLRRQMAFKHIAEIDLTAAVLAVVVGIATALAGGGVWSLVAASLTNATIRTILFWWKSSWYPRFYLNWNEVRAIASYSINLSGSNIFNYFTLNADNLLVGRFLGTTALGFYSLSYIIVLTPLQRLSWALNKVFFPAFAHIQHDNARIRRAYLRLCAVVAAITFPLMLGLLATADLVVLILLGSQWAPIIPLLIILAPVSVIHCIGMTVANIYKAKGRTDWMFRWGLVSGTLTVGAFVVGLRWGINGVASAYAIATFLLAYPRFAIPLRLIQLPMHEFVRAIWPGLKYGLIMAATVIVSRLALVQMGIADSWMVLVGAILVGIIVYAGLLILYKPPVVQDSARMLPLNQIPVLRRIALRIGLVLD